MLEYFTYKKVKKHRQETKAKEEEQKAAADDVLDADEQMFLERLTQTASHSDGEDGDDGDGEGDRPALPPRAKTPELIWDSESESFVREDERREKETKGTKEASTSTVPSTSTSSFGRRLSQLLGPRRDKSAAHLVVPGRADVNETTAEEEARERDEMARVLEELDQAARGDEDENDKNDKTKTKAKKMAFALSSESTELVRRFVVVLRDLVGGVPTAADDLRHLLDDRDGTLSRGFERLPSGLRKLVAQLPAKLTTSLAPELLAAAAESQGLAYEHKDGSTRPTAPRPPPRPFLLFVLWYCHKRGREVRLGNEAQAAAASAAALDTATSVTIEAPVAIRTFSPDDVDVLPSSHLSPPPIGSGAAVPKPE
ncbi:hypothetical protein CMQ_4133 [Grosmannia clavigera kw1407]|uniref:Uncharacterized protein n=1 Tax=Grosmannia clavigera (strain kw1407 / UAMH 11150) TaxID=655863 RepID=F0X8L8_GROCL|nr:uncharacterized protein CMQ_4133 [Grosmannia clavigera kw1407]EFX06064.1 hypothetical protein CMQ_4133 [Grosmannia clavigera kw1407]